MRCSGNRHIRGHRYSPAADNEFNEAILIHQFLSAGVKRQQSCCGIICRLNNIVSTGRQVTAAIERKGSSCQSIAAGIQHGSRGLRQSSDIQSNGAERSFCIERSATGIQSEVINSYRFSKCISCTALQHHLGRTAGLGNLVGNVYRNSIGVIEDEGIIRRTEGHITRTGHAICSRISCSSDSSIAATECHGKDCRGRKSYITGIPRNITLENNAGIRTGSDFLQNTVAGNCSRKDLNILRITISNHKTGFPISLGIHYLHSGTHHKGIRIAGEVVIRLTGAISIIHLEDDSLVSSVTGKIQISISLSVNRYSLCFGIDRNCRHSLRSAKHNGHSSTGYDAGTNSCCDSAHDCHAGENSYSKPLREMQFHNFKV